MSENHFSKEVTDPQPPPQSEVLIRLLKLCWQDRWRCIQVLVLQALQLFFGLVGLGLSGLGIDYLRAHVQSNAPRVHGLWGWIPPNSWSPMEAIGVVAGLVLIAAILRGIFTWLAGVVLAELVHRGVVANLQTGIFARLQHLSFRFFDHQSRGAIINRATGDIQAVRTFVDTVLIQAVVTLMSLIVYASYMVTINVGLTLACLSTLPLMWIACIVFSRFVHPEYMKNRDLFDQMIRTLAECVEGVAVIKGFAREEQVSEKFRDYNRQVKDQQGRIFQYVSFFTPGIEFLTQINLIVLLLYGGWLVAKGQLPLGTGLIVFAGILQQFSSQVATISQIANGVQESLAGAGRVFAVLDAPLGLTLPPKPAPAPRGPGAVRFENVSFGYAEGRHVLKKINFSIQPGECVAIVGETGSGKSALLSLIPRFYDPDQGRILLDNLDVKTFDLQALRKRVGFVFQESFLFSDTVSSNIALGDKDASMEKIIKVATMAHAHDFIMALPNQYETILGESGVDLSGGQRQRLAIARALLTDPAILLLDDPTAAIDAETEHEIMAAIEKSLVGRTTFIVAHRLSTLRRANRIFVLERGTIVQEGTHEVLLNAEGPYQMAALHQMIDDESRRLLSQEIQSRRDPWALPSVIDQGKEKVCV